MSNISRRKFVTTGLAVAAGASGIAVAAKVARHHGLIPPDAGGLYGPGETLTYAAQRLLTRHSLPVNFLARRFREIRSPMSLLRRATNSNDSSQPVSWTACDCGWHGGVRPFSLEEIRSFPVSTYITMIGCEKDGLTSPSGPERRSLHPRPCWRAAPGALRCLPLDPT